MSTKRNYSKEEMQQRLASLPNDVQELLYSPDMTNALNQVAKQHSLHIDQMGILEAEVVAAMLGFTEPQDFPGILGEQLGVNAAIAKSVAEDINTQLFQKIRESLKKMTGFNVEEEKPVAESKPAAIEVAPGRVVPFVKSVATVTPIRPVAPQPAAKPAAVVPTTQSAPMAKPAIPAPMPTSTISLPKEVPVISTTSTSAPEPSKEAPVQPHPADVLLQKPTITLPKTQNIGLQPLISVPPEEKTPQTPAPASDAAATKQYTADPYQEPIDGH